jgi:hypothetical protein
MRPADELRGPTQARQLAGALSRGSGASPTAAVFTLGRWHSSPDVIRLGSCLARNLLSHLIQSTCLTPSLSLNERLE